MRPTTATVDNVFDFQALLHFGTVFEHPKDVVMHPSLTLGEKRAILASWASDASAIASCPALRAPEGLKMPVSIDAILEALCELDGGPRNPPGGKPQRRFSTARAGRLKVQDRIRLPGRCTPAAAQHSETIPSIRQEVRDLRGKLSLRVRFRETCDVYHFTPFQLSEPRRKQDRKSRILASHFSRQLDS
jgi:hypothetical protein